MIHFYRAHTVELHPGTPIAWPGHDSCNKKSGLRVGYVREVKDDGSVKVEIDGTSGASYPYAAKFHTIRPAELRKAFIMLGVHV